MQPGWIVGYGDMLPAPLAVKESFQIKKYDVANGDNVAPGLSE